MVRVKFFGTLRIESGIKEFTAEARTVRELYPLALREIKAKCPDSPLTEKALRGCMTTVNGKQAGPGTRLREGDVVFLFPAVAGG